jgi:four helix bundle protein
MGTIKWFEDLECWQEARVYVRIVYAAARGERFRRDFELAGQLIGSAISSMANIAEGFHRNSKRDFMKFLDYSRSSIAESLSHCYVALDQGYITPEQMNELKRKAESVWKKVNGFISYLNKSEMADRAKRTNRTNKNNETNKPETPNEPQ